MLLQTAKVLFKLYKMLLLKLRLKMENVGQMFKFDYGIVNGKLVDIVKVGQPK